MKKMIKRRPSPALVIALIALFAALGGSAYALSRNSVKAKNIKNGAVTTKKIKNKAVTSSKLAPGAVTPATISQSNGVLPLGFAADDVNLTFKEGNVVGANNPGQGVYCFNLSSKVNGGTATIDSNDSTLNALISASTNAAAPCAAPFTDFRVDTFQGSAHSNQAFFLALF
jgi:hypothetical protein